MLFRVDYDRFIREIGVEKIKPGDRNVLEIEDLGTMWAYYLNSLDRHQTYVLIVGKKELSSIQKSNLDAMSMPSRRITETLNLRIINETLRRIENNLNKIPTQEKVVEVVEIPNES